MSGVGTVICLDSAGYVIIRFPNLTVSHIGKVTAAITQVIWITLESNLDPSLIVHSVNIDNPVHSHLLVQSLRGHKIQLTKLEFVPGVVAYRIRCRS